MTKRDDDDAQSVRSSTTDFADVELKEQLDTILKTIETLKQSNA